MTLGSKGSCAEGPAGFLPEESQPLKARAEREYESDVPKSHGHFPRSQRQVVQCSVPSECSIVIERYTCVGKVQAQGL